MSKKHTFHRENCNTCIRKSKVDILDRVIILSGTHAFEWSVTIISNGAITITQFADRMRATKEFNRYKKKKNENNH